MWKALSDLVRMELSPEKDWSTYLRKILSTIVLTTVLIFGVETYKSFTTPEDSWEDRPLHTRIKKGNIRADVIKYLEVVFRQNQRHLNSIWVYSWPDARTLIPVAHVGSPNNPIPLGYFTVNDSGAVGAMVMEQCAILERAYDNLIACPIFAENDAWGVVVFVCDDPDHAPYDWKNMFRSLAHKLSHVIYQTND